VESLALAFLTNRPLPSVPARLQRRWAGLDGRLRECLLATVIDRVTGNRAQAVRSSYDPHGLAASVATVALRMLEHGTGAGTQAGPGWVIPQLRWLHEIERVCPLRGPAPGAMDRAPPLDFDLPGLADWPDMQVGHRLRVLRRHPLSMGLARNRAPAWSVLLGDDDQRAFTDDLASALVGAGPKWCCPGRAGSSPITSSGRPARTNASMTPWADSIVAHGQASDPCAARDDHWRRGGQDVPAGRTGRWVGDRRRHRLADGT
jgi:hypothetical protein